MGKFDKILSRVITVLTAVGCAFMVLSMLLIVMNIITRVFDKPIIGTYEGVKLAIGVMVSFAIGYTALKDGHVNMDMIIIRLPKIVQKILFIITSIISLGIWGLIVWFNLLFDGTQFLIKERTIIMEWPVYPFRYVFLLGAILMCLVFLSSIIKAIKEKSK
jgi:TRAP-type C4-dicarboxylate transport system permease small subunit